MTKYSPGWRTLNFCFQSCRWGEIKFLKAKYGMLNHHIPLTVWLISLRFYWFFVLYFCPFLTHNFLFYTLVLQTILFHAAAAAIRVPFRCCLSDGTEQKSPEHFVISLKLVHCERADGCQKSERKEITIFYIFFCYHKRKLKEESKSLKLFLMRLTKLSCWLEEEWISCVNCCPIKRMNRQKTRGTDNDFNLEFF